MDRIVLNLACEEKLIWMQRSSCISLLLMVPTDILDSFTSTILLLMTVKLGQVSGRQETYTSEQQGHKSSNWVTFYYTFYCISVERMKPHETPVAIKFWPLIGR
jgi:hypothetical protein